MEEEWMRDRALLRDLLQKTPQASSRELAQVTIRADGILAHDTFW